MLQSSTMSEVSCTNELMCDRRLRSGPEATDCAVLDVGGNAFGFGIRLAFAIALILVVSCAPHATPRQVEGPDAHADALVAQLRDLPPQIPLGPFSVSCVGPDPCQRPPLPPEEAKRRQIYDELYELGPSGVPALARALESSDVGLRRNATLALDVLGGRWWFYDRHPPEVDISAALPALIAALGDSDPNVRWGAAADIGHVGPAAAEAVPKLAALLRDKNEGVRDNACLGLKGIGPAAKDALPALKHALSDPSLDVRRFAQFAIEHIEGNLKPSTDTRSGS